ncbi:hypothetical protein SCAB_45541 [Streptomyces scabiei 87.22]|uniref:Uncharacterized protein n=1 Tax=Streptomyces scabiei (strain 87.22) TaxID=680198 RepID=C9ZAI1_STRSW|nr:hypothetical protein SCAB_45541 [Streptomyces scabiei 87.22]
MSTIMCIFHVPRSLARVESTNLATLTGLDRLDFDHSG